MHKLFELCVGGMAMAAMAGATADTSLPAKDRVSSPDAGLRFFYLFLREIGS
jgi:hypothetical protein